MKIVGKKWTGKQPLSLDLGDPFRTGMGAVGTPLAAKLVGKLVLTADVFKATQNRSGGARSVAMPSSESKPGL